MVPFNPQKYYDSQIATIKNQLANWDFSGAAQTAASTNSNLGPWGMRIPQDLTDINGYIAKMSPQEQAQYQKLQEANKLLAAGNNGNNVLRATKSDVANNLSAQQIANNKVIGYWSNESEAFSRVINAINTSPEKIKFIRDEGGNLAAITTGEHPGYDTLGLTPTGQKGVYQFTTYNQVAGGNISGALIADPTTGKVAPVINAASQFAYTPGQPGSWVRNTVGGLLGGISDLFGSLGPLGTLALAYVTGGAGVAIGEALGLSGTAAAVAGNTIINTALNGGDVGKALTSSLTSLAGAEAGGLAGDFAKSGEIGSFMKDNPQYATQLASTLTRTVAQGGDVSSALTNAALGIATDAATSQIDGFKDLPPAVQNTVKASIQAELQGKDVNVEGTIKNAAVNGLTSYALSQNDDFKNLDPKAQTLVANQISAGLQGKDLSSEAIKWAMNQGNQEIAKAVKGTPESEINQILDMPATAEPSPTGVDQVSDQDLEQLGVGLPTEIAQTEQEAPYKTIEDLIGLSDQQAKELGFPDYKTQQMYGGNVEAYKQDVAGKESISQLDPTELAYLNYRNQLEDQPGFSNLEDFKKYGGDYTQYLLDQPQEPKSTDELISQIGLAPEITTPETPGSETTPEYAPQDLGITPENLASYQENLQKMEEEDQLPSQWQPNEDGTYTMIGDDGSTITIDETGDIVHYTEAPEGNLPGETLPVTTSPTATTTTAPPATTTAGPTTTPVVTTPTGQPQVKDVTKQEKPGLSAEQLGYLLDMLYPSNQQQQVEEEAASPYANIDLNAPEFAGLDYLGAMRKAPEYLGEDQLSEEDMAMLETIGLSPDEISNILESSGMKGSGAIKPGMGVPEGTFKPAGSRTYDIYRALEKDPAMAAKIRQLPLAGFSDDYTKQFISSAEQALNPAWATYRPGVEVAKSFQPPLSQGDARTAAYVPKYDVNTYTGFNPEKYGASSATTPETIGLVTTNPAYLSDPTAAANLMAHELTHIKQVDPNFLLMEAGGTQQDKQSFAKDLASSIPYLREKYGYAGGYDTQANAPMSERFADLMGWQFQNNLDFSNDPQFQKMVLNTPERIAAWNASTVPRTTRLDPRDLPPGKIVESDFGLPGAAPLSWQLQEKLRRLLPKQ